MKKIKYLFLIIVTLLVSLPRVYAASASISISSNSKTVIVGSTVKVNVKVSSSDLGSWEYCLSYDSSVLKLVDSTADANSCVKAGVVSSEGQRSSTETFKFKAIKSGSSKISVKSYAIYGYSTEEQMKTSISSIKINTMTNSELQATYSKDADLKSLSVKGYEITPKFAKKTLEYNLEVENEVENVTISASKNESHASISGVGEKKLNEGNNKFEIIVTAQKGNKKTYVVNVYRKELNPISVEVDGKQFTYVRKAEDLPEYKTFSLSSIEVDEQEIPAKKSEITGLTIVGLKDESGNIQMYTYENEVKEKYIELNSASLSICPQELENKQEFNDFIKTTITINEEEVSAYKTSKESKQAIIRGLNVETGDILYYLYDETDSTFIRYNSELKDMGLEKLSIYKLIILSMAGAIVILIITLIVVASKKKKNISNF